MGTIQSSSQSHHILSQCYCLNNKKPLHESAVIQVSQHTNKFIIKGQLNFNKQSTFKKLQIAANQYSNNIHIGQQYVPLLMRLLAYNQQNIFNALQTLSKVNTKVKLLQKISQIDLDLMDSLYSNIVNNHSKNSSQLTYHIGSSSLVSQNHNFNINAFKPLSLSNLPIEDKINLINNGRQLLQQGKIAIVFMCTGPSSRFFFQDKFLHNLQINNQENSTILKVMFEKLRENVLGQKQKTMQKTIIDLPIIIIGNQTNTQSIENYVRENSFFNFNKHSIYFSTIQSLPILDKQGKLCMNFQYNYLRRPKGSAFCLQEIINPQAMEILKQRSIQYLHVVGTENLAQTPGDPLFIGITKMLKRNVAIKCTKIETNDEYDRGRFDVICCENNRLRVKNKFQLSQQFNDGNMKQDHNVEHQNKEQVQQEYVGMNSMIFELSNLCQIIQKFNLNPQKSMIRSYRCYEIRENVYDFKVKKPILGEKCYSFEKDIKDLIMVADRPLVVGVDSDEFIPIVTHKGQYSIEQAIARYQQGKKQRDTSKGFMKTNNINANSNKDNIKKYKFQSQVKSQQSQSTKSYQKHYNKNKGNDQLEYRRKNQNLITQ